MVVSVRIKLNEWHLDWVIWGRGSSGGTGVESRDRRARILVSVSVGMLKSDVIGLYISYHHLLIDEFSFPSLPSSIQI